MSTTHAEVVAAAPVSTVPAQVQRCGGTACPPGTCDHDEEVARDADGPAPAAVPPTVLGVLATPGTPLDAGTRTAMEGRFGHDFGRVRIHTDAQAARSATDIQALAYTFGSHVVMGAARYQPHSTDGQRLLAHELTHVTQQGEQAGSPTSISDPHDPAELAAERAAVGASAGEFSPAPAVLARQATTAPGGPGRDPCLQLLEEIIALLDEVARRINDALNDPHRLFDLYRTEPHPDGYGSWEGHRDRFTYDRGRLREKLAEWDSNDECRGRPLLPEQQTELTEAREYAEKEFPARPAPSMREAQAPEPSLRERIADFLIRVGVPAAVVTGLVVLIIAALADPEPFSKVALLIGAAAAVAFFVLLGRRAEVPGGATVASAEPPTVDEGEPTPTTV